MRSLASVLLIVCSTHAAQGFAQDGGVPRAEAATVNLAAFEAWLTELKAEAKKRKFSETTLAALEGLEPIPEVIEKDRYQPEKAMTFEAYRTRILSEWRINKGRALLAQHRETLDQVAEKYGVHPEFIVALWGVESAYGTRQGDFSIVAALATLAHEGRRATFFRGELFSALKILEGGHIAADAMKGSWAGAMGQCQFMPSTFLRHAADFNGDGRKDIWGTEADVFASAATYLSRLRWKRNLPWGQEVEVPAKLEAGLWNQKLAKTMTEWRKLGIKTKGGGLVEAGPLKATLVRPDQEGGPAYLLHANYHALLNWNRSRFFGAAVSHLAGELMKPAPVTEGGAVSDGGVPVASPDRSDAGTR